jgi:hypothetical protein
MQQKSECICVSRDSTPRPLSRYFSAMSSCSSTQKAAKKRWRIVLMRSKGQVLGIVEALDLKRAEAAAVRAFMLTEDQRKRLLVQEYA